jgi:hypothetical protein
MNAIGAWGLRSYLVMTIKEAHAILNPANISGY